ncbi:hypothetical protein XA68_13130 [Ophiocordyceps unilateralis]|uniref:Fungal lipase-type domain-containing protein n=1 Tax=Ophiocordyceps unilateralis TaxID=268505 RepID=A0A2A9PMG3_OPHUN|nr:hypothetical protein XA68_13130 [Ophiocordyceps unilateralis]
MCSLVTRSRARQRPVSSASATALTIPRRHVPTLNHDTLPLFAIAVIMRLAWTLVGPVVLASSSGPVAASIPTPLFGDLERLSRIADIAYCVGNSGVRKPFHCLSHCSDFPELSLVTSWHTGLLLGDSCGYIALDRAGPDILVVFRGTYSVTNTIADLSTVPQPYMPYPGPDGGRPGLECTNCSVHTGFFQSWRSARRLVLPELEALKAEYPTAAVQLVGHSLGGAVACLAALELKVSLGWHDVRVSTFGEPRLGNDGLARFVDSVFHLDRGLDVASWSYRRVTHVDDPVPLLPWDEWGYSSHAGEIYISKPDLAPTEYDLRPCVGDGDAECSTGARRAVRQTLPRHHLVRRGADTTLLGPWPPLFAHRDYFWRLGLCVPGGDPANWGRSPASPMPDEL